MSTIRNSTRAISAISPSLRRKRTTAVGREEMRLGEVERDADPLARLERDRIEHARGPVVAAEWYENQGLVAERLGQRNGELALDDLASGGRRQAVSGRV